MPLIIVMRPDQKEKTATGDYTLKYEKGHDNISC